VSEDRCPGCGCKPDPDEGKPCVWCESIARQRDWMTQAYSPQGLSGMQANANQCQVNAQMGNLGAQQAQRIDQSVASQSELATAKARIAELEATCAMHRRADKTVNELVVSCNELQQRNMVLSDQAGTRHRERDELLRENAMLRRELGRLERKAKR
jgi:FtsZ-binding cell division protein ZapB